MSTRSRQPRSCWRRPCSPTWTTSDGWPGWDCPLRRKRSRRVCCWACTSTATSRQRTPSWWRIRWIPRHGGNRRQIGDQLLLDLVVWRVAGCKSQAMTLGVQHDVDVVGIVEGHRGAFQRCVIELPVRRVPRPDHLRDFAPVGGETRPCTAPAGRHEPYTSNSHSEYPYGVPRSQPNILTYRAVTGLNVAVWVPPVPLSSSYTVAHL